MEIGLNRILGAWHCFGKNPGLAMRVLIAEAGAIVLPSSSNPVRYVLELEKSGYLEDSRTLAIGTVMLQALLFLSLYLFFSLTYGVLWY